MTARSLRHELVVSTLVGPLRYAVPILSYAVLYPLILRRYGLEVLGLWSLLSTIIAYITLADAGFSSVFTREMSSGDGSALAHAHGPEYKAARWFYLALMALLLAILAASFPLWRQTAAHLPAISSPAIFGLDIAALIIAGIAVLAGKLESAILLAQTQIVYTQLVSSVSPIILFAANLAGVFSGHPIEGFAFGALFSSLAEYGLYHVKLHRVLPDFLPECRDITASSGTFRHLGRLGNRGKYLYIYQLGGMVREPIFRLIIGGSLGLAAVGVFDIAFRLTRTVMDITSGGIVRALFPGLSRLIRENRQETVSSLLQATFVIMLVFAACGQGGVILLARPFYALWLGSVPEHLVASTLVFALWFLVNTIFIPFTNLLMANRNEQVLAAGMWAHILLSLLLFPFLIIGESSVVGAAALWSAGGCATVSIQACSVAKKMPHLVGWIAKPDMLPVMLAGAGMVILMAALGVVAPPSPLTQFAIWGVAASAYSLLAIAFLLRTGFIQKPRWPRRK